jgi:hypothetical protein
MDRFPSVDTQTKSIRVIGGDNGHLVSPSSVTTPLDRHIGSVEMARLLSQYSTHNDNNNSESGTGSISPQSKLTPTAPETAALQRELHFAAEIGQYLLEQNQELERALEEYRLEGEWLRSLLTELDASHLTKVKKVPLSMPSSSKIAAARKSLEASSIHRTSPIHGNLVSPSPSLLAVDQHQTLQTPSPALLQQSERQAYESLYDRYALLREEHVTLQTEADKHFKRFKMVQSELDALKLEMEALKVENQRLDKVNGALATENAKLLTEAKVQAQAQSVAVEASATTSEIIQQQQLQPSLSSSSNQRPTSSTPTAVTTTPTSTTTNGILSPTNSHSTQNYRTLATSHNISTIVRLMVGTYLLKYNKRRTKMDKRYVMVNPYTRTISWSAKDPRMGEAGEEVKTGMLHYYYYCFFWSFCFCKMAASH